MLDPSSIHQSRSLDLIFALIMQPDCVYFTVEGRKRPLSLFPLFALEVLLEAFSPSAARQQNFPWPLSPRHVPLTGTGGTQGCAWHWNIIPTCLRHHGILACGTGSGVQDKNKLPLASSGLTVNNFYTLTWAANVVYVMSFCLSEWRVEHICWPLLPSIFVSRPSAFSAAGL